ncbi:V-set and immunoglobulin domain-containing protein 4-like [Notechis scutatus]|uniref:V-set and immunoglobulin domain-containing protein 4-like n=1 Tax=Notechis scutatus TaxID=8663 RepID=UPI000E782B23|nr:V-set and immunoglobulin domain-containing protein 4-like [Notechis scutatus]
MERWAQLWILSLVAVVPGKVALDWNSTQMVSGTWRAPAILPCVYGPSSDFKQLKVTWKFFQPGEAPRTILHRDASGDHIFLAAFRDRVNIAKKIPGDVSLHIKELEMTDIGSFICLVDLEAQNRSRVTREKTVQLMVVKVPASKPSIEASSRESVLPSGTRLSLTCSASGSLPIYYRWYKEGPGEEAEELRRGPVLAFEGLQRSDSARYFCTAENRLNVRKEQSDSFQLTVKDASEVSTAGPAAESGGTSTGGVATSSTAFGDSPGQQKESKKKERLEEVPGAPSAQKTRLPLYIIILIAVLSAAFILMAISVVFCRRRTKSDNLYQVTYNNNALTLEGNEAIPASPGVNNTCLYEAPNSSFGNNYTMEPTKADEYVAMGEKMDNEYEILVIEKQLGR